MAVAGISSAAVLVRLAEAPAASTAFWRLSFSVALLTPLLAATGQWREIRALGRTDLAWLLASGALLAIHFVAWFRSLDFTSVAASTVLVTSHPLFVGLLSAALLREAPSRLEWAGIAVAVAGAALIGWGDFGAGPDPLRGDLLAAGAAVAAALYFICGRRLRPRLGLWGYVVPVYAVAALLTGAVAVVQGVPLVGWAPGTWAAFLGLAVGPTLLGHTGFNWALRHVRAYVVSLTQLLEPVGATLLAVAVLGAAERPSLELLAGGAAILAGTALPLRVRRSAAESGSPGREGGTG